MLSWHRLVAGATAEEGRGAPEAGPCKDPAPSSSSPRLPLKSGTVEGTPEVARSALTIYKPAQVRSQEIKSLLKVCRISSLSSLPSSLAFADFSSLSNLGWICK